MKIIMLSGGSGKRLWPMSNDSRSKQFLKVLRDENGNLISMLQRIWGQLGRIGLQQNAFVCASRAQREIIESQLGDVPFIEEPTRRDTFPAIALATLYLADEQGCSPDEVVVVLPIDHMVDDSYFIHASRLEQVIHASGAQLALMGVTPTEPSSKFGYIRPVHSEGTNAMTHGVPAANPIVVDPLWTLVESFVEKPDTPTAERLLKEGALWNCGVFAFRIDYIQQILSDNGYPTTYHGLHSNFVDMPKRSFDYEVVERTKAIAVSPYAGKWNDLGTWEALCTEIPPEFVGSGEATSCHNTHVINELGIPLLTVGLENSVVIATPDGILVADKAETASIKDLVSAYENRPMYEERRWGSYRVLDYQKLEDGTEVLTRTIELLPSRNISYQKHMKRSEVWTVLDGRGELVLDERIFRIEAGDVVRVHAGQWHAIRALGKLTFIEVQRGSELIEEDIIRRFLTWEETVAYCETVAGREL